ncbi:MAG TPA: DUF1292 domain-containing protein [Lachnospiraceae bacterium]|nr:DUF1292 domain-containing protein [Lachnospiraceae bacterium]
METIEITTDEGEVISLYVLEQTRLGGINYLLVTEEEDGDADAMILKEVSGEEDEEGIYEIVSDDNELSAVSTVFEDLLDDIKFIGEV